MKTSILLLGAALILFTRCGNQTTAGETAGKDSTASFDIAAVKASVAESNKAFADAILKGDSSAIADLYTSDAIMLPPNMPKAVGHDGILHVASALTQMGIGQFSLESTDVYGNGDLVAEEGNYTVGDKSGKTVDEGKYIVLWKQQDGKWKLYRDIWNSNMPPATGK